MRMRSATTDFAEATMNRTFPTMIAVAALALVAIPAAAQAENEASLEQRLEDAQRRLEEAAREVAELSSEAGGPEMHRAFEFRLPPPSRHAMLGVNLGGAQSGGGVRVNGVSPGGPAAEAGVRTGDVIVAIQAKPVTTGREVVKVMEAIEPGDKVALEIKRDGKPVKVAVEARPLDQVYFFGNGVIPPIPAVPAIESLPTLPPMAIAMADSPHWLLDEWGDAEFASLTPRLGRYFGADKGVLVVRAPENKALGLQDGDVIVSIGGREPQDGRHAMRILRTYQPGEAVELKIFRDRRAQTLNLKVPARAQRDVLHRRLLPPPAPPSPPEAATAD
jgi:predicted metalloprotease with PDZ domain